jgi:hypothetical protein
MSQSCSILNAQIIAQIVRDVLRQYPNHPWPEARLGRFQLERRDFAIGEPPSWIKGSWKETFPKLSSLLSSLDRLAKRYPELEPQALWNDPRGREVLRALQKADRRTAWRLVGDYLIEKGYPEAATAFQFPALAFVPFPIGSTKSRAVPNQPSSGKPEPFWHLSPEARKLVEEIRKNPENWPKVIELLQNQVERTADIARRIVQLQQDLEELLIQAKRPIQPGTLTLAELIATVAETGDRELQRRASALVASSGLVRVSDDPLDVFLEELVRAAQKDIQDRIEQIPSIWPAAIRQIYDSFLAPIRRFTREFSIATIRYIMMQLFQDAVIKPFLAGYGRAIPDILKEYRAFYRLWSIGLDLQISPSTLREAGFVARSGLDLELQRHGINLLPEEIVADLERDMNFFELQAFRAEASSLWQLPVVGKLLQGIIPLPGRGIEVGPLAKVLRHRYFPTHLLARFSSWVSVMARAQEAATRKAIFGAAFLGKLWSEEVDRFVQDLDELGSRWGVENLGQETLKLLRSRRSYRRQDVEAAVAQVSTQALGAYNPVLIQQASFLWWDRVQTALRYGVREAQRVNYDYLRRTVGDDILSFIFKFHFWASRNLPFYYEEFLRHRALFRLWVRVREDQARDEQEGKRSSRLGQAIKVLEFWLFGNYALVYIDLFDLISVTTQLNFVTEYGEPRTAWESLTRLGGSLTFSPNWDLSLVAWILGYDLRHSPPSLAPGISTIFRALGLQGWVSLDRIYGPLRTQLSGRLPGSQKRWASDTLTGSLALDRSIWIELLILSYERTGRPDHPAYIRAMANPDDPLFQEARDRVLERTQVEQGLSFVLPQRVLIEPGTEAELRELQAAAGWRELSPEQRRQLILQHRPEAWTAFIPRDLREAQIRAAEAERQLDRLNGREQPLEFYTARYPWYGAYLLWAEDQPEGTDRSVRRFLASVR